MKKLLLAVLAAGLCFGQTGTTGLATRQSTATIAISTTTSTPIYMGDYIALILRMPSAFTGTSVTFTCSPDNIAAYQQLTVGGSAYTETVAASKDVVLDGSVFAGCEWIKVVSGSSEAAARTLIVISRGGTK